MATGPRWIRHFTSAGDVTGQNLRGALDSTAALTRAARRNHALWPPFIGRLKGRVTPSHMTSVSKAEGGSEDAAEPPVTPTVLAAAFGDLARDFAIVFEGTLGESPDDFVECVRVLGGRRCGCVCMCV